MASRPGLAILLVLAAAAAAGGGATETSGRAGAALAADGGTCGAEMSCPAISALQRDAARYRQPAAAVADAGDAGGDVVDPASDGGDVVDIVAAGGDDGGTLSNADGERGLVDSTKAVMTALESVVEMHEICKTVKANEGLQADAAFWPETVAKVKSLILKDLDMKEFVEICQAGSLNRYTRKGCSPKAAGSTLTRGVPTDAWFCGRREGMDWGEVRRPYADLCHAAVGSAYKPGGICAVGDKQLLLNYVHRGPVHWAEPTLINVPSVHCILGIADCDIHYCQHCAERCGSK